MSVFIAGTMTGLTSCLKSDYDECVDDRGNVRLTFSLDENVVSRGSISDYQIDSISIYVFDASTARYEAVAGGGKYFPGQVYELFLTLKGGLYDFIVWTNQGEIYKSTIPTFEVTPKNDMELFMDHSAVDFSKDIPDLLYGTPRDANGNPRSITIIEKRDNHVPIVLTPNVYKINIEVTGLPASATGNYSFAVTDNNSRYEFSDNSIINSDPDFQYVRTATAGGGKIETSMKVLQLTSTRTPDFIFKDSSGNILFENDLVELITRAYATGSTGPVDFNKTFVFNIKLECNINMEMTASVNGWEYKKETNELE